MATWLEKSRSPEYSPAKLSRMLAEVEAVIGISELDEAMAHETIIVGGYLNTHLIKAKSILAEYLDVDSLSAISANIGEVTSGTITGALIRTSAGDDRIELSSNLLRAYSGGTRRVQLDYDSLDFYNSSGIKTGEIIGADSSPSGEPRTLWITAIGNALTLHASTSSSNDEYALIDLLPNLGGRGGRIQMSVNDTFGSSTMTMDSGGISIASDYVEMTGDLSVYGAITNASINASQLTGTIASARLPTIPSNKLPIRAGSFTVTAGASTSVSFSSSLPSTVRVVANVGGSSSTDYGTLKVYNVSTSGFNATLRGGATQDTITCYYIAVGGF